MKDLWLILLVCFVVPGCAYIGHDEPTVEEKFYETDRMTILALDTAANVLALEEDRISDEVKQALAMTVDGLVTTRTEVRAWVDACGKIDSDCKQIDRISLGIDSMQAAVELVSHIILEVKQ